MGRPQALSEEESFEAYYLAYDSPAPVGVDTIASSNLRGKVTGMTVSNSNRRVREHLEKQDETAKRYSEWLQGKRRRRSIFDVQPDGKITSPFPGVQGFITRKGGTKFRSLKSSLEAADRAYHYLDYKDPQNWTGADAKEFVDHETKSNHVKMSLLISLRRVAPQLMDYNLNPESPRPGDYKEKNFKRYFLFDKEISGALDHMERLRMVVPNRIIKTHLVLGCREGSVVHKGEERDRGGLLGLKWSDVTWSNPERGGRPTIDIFETKTKGGTLWRDCPLDLFGWECDRFLREIKGKKLFFNVGDKTYNLDASSDRIFGMSYEALREIYDVFEKVLKELFPLSRFDAVTPHTARHLHTNLLKEREIDDMSIIGDGKAGMGPYGVGWETFDTYKDYYTTMNFGSRKAAAEDRAARQRSVVMSRQIMAESEKMAEAGKVE